MNTAAAQSDGFFGGNSSTTAFAIPIDKALTIVNQIRAGNNSDTVHVGDRAILGVEVRNVPQVGSSAPVASGAAIVGVREVDGAGTEIPDRRPQARVVGQVQQPSVLDAARATGEKTFVHVAILGLALAAGADGDPTVAATLHGAADHLYEQAGQAFDAVDLDLRASSHARLLGALGQAAFDAAGQLGRTLSQADAIALALSTAQPDPGPGPAPPDSPAGPLSARETQILALLAGGASNATIAGTLYVTPNTVRTHLDRIRDKTGARNRAELTRYAIQAGIEPVVPAP